MAKNKTKEIDPQELEKARKRMSWAVGFLVVSYHFVYRILALTCKTAQPGLGTMGVKVNGGGQFELLYDPIFVNNLKDEELTFVMYHEVMHLALHHCTQRRFDNHQIGNIATDLAVNELIPISNTCKPPSDICSVARFKKEKDFKDIKGMQTSEWYYKYLMKKAKENGGKGKGYSGKGFDNHDGWSENEVADEKVRAKISEIEKGDLWGKIEGSTKEMILSAQTRKINWKNILRQFYGNQIWPERDSTRKRPNRRTGYIHPGNRKVQLDRHLIAVDTSGSIESELLAQFLGTINQMTEYVPIDIMQVDFNIQSEPRPFERRHLKYDFLGRGGTNFQPIMDTVTERKYKSVVILTDGEASPCTKPNAKVVWVMPPGHKPPVDWGQQIHLTQY